LVDSIEGKLRKELKEMQRIGFVDLGDVGSTREREMMPL